MPDQPTTVLRLPDGRYVTPEQAQGMTFHDDYKPVEGVWTPQPSPREASSVRKQHDDVPRALSPDEINADLAEYMEWLPYRCLDRRDAWQPAAAAKDAVFRNPTECLNACAAVARKAGAVYIVIPPPSGVEGVRAILYHRTDYFSPKLSENFLGTGVREFLAVATALHRLLFPEKHSD